MAEEKTTRKPTQADLEALGRTFGSTAEDLRTTLSSLTVRACKDGETLVREGELGSDVYVVLKGTMAVRRSRFVFMSREVARLGPGDFFGEIGFLVPAARSASVSAVGPCEVFRMVADDMKALLERKPDLRAGMEETARRRLYALSGVKPE